MDGLEKPALPKEDEVKEGRLYKEMMASKPRFSSKEEALAHYRKELESLSKRLGLSPTEMFNRFEHGTEENDDYREAAHILARIAFFKRK